MNRYFDFLNHQEDANELNAASLLVDEFGIEYRIAEDITSEWVRMNIERSRRANRYSREV